LTNDPTSSFNPRNLTDDELKTLDPNKLNPEDLKALGEYKKALEAIDNLTPERLIAILAYLREEGIIDLKRDAEGKPELRDGLPIYIPNEHTDFFYRIGNYIESLVPEGEENEAQTPGCHAQDPGAVREVNSGNVVKTAM
jgi:hypothetical protein